MDEELELDSNDPNYHEHDCWDHAEYYEHDCWDHAEYYEFYEEGHRFHGYDCSKCGKFLQSG